MITEAQKQQFKLKGYDKLIVSRGEIIAINTRGVKDWNSKKQREFFDKTGLSIFFEGDGNPVFYDSRYFSFYPDSQSPYLVYIGDRCRGIPKPINCHSMFGMFSMCRLGSIDLRNWDMHMVYDASAMFAESKLKSINLAGLNFEHLEQANYMFSECRSLRSLDLTGLYLPRLKLALGVFDNCLTLSNRSQKSLVELEEAFRNGNFGKV